MVKTHALQKSFASLDSALALYDADLRRDDAPVKTLMRDGVIQRFEYTFEIAWKTIKRYLEEHGLERVDALQNKELFRLAFEQGLIEDPARWFDYLKAGNKTSHIYSEAVADEVFAAIRDFLKDMRSLLMKLQTQ